MHCTDCGHENPAGYRFCGMCGKTLPRPVATPPLAADVEEPEPVYIPDILDRRALASERLRSAPETPDTSISGPSFLGLGDQHSTPEFSYLLEDEPRRSPGRWLVAFIILLALGAAGWWQVRQHGGTAWLMSMLRNAKQITGKAEDGVPADRLNRSRAALLGSATNPNATKEADLQLQNHDLVPKTGESLDLKKPASPSPDGEANGSPSSETPSSQPGRVNAEDAVRKQAAPERQPAASQSEPGSGTEAAVRKPPSGDDESQSSKGTSRNGVEQAAVREGQNHALTAKADGSHDESDTTEPAPGEKTRGARRNSSPTDGTTLVAEKYLYGQGVRQDCNRALNLLRPAADSNVKARTLLGAMYATGHCVPRDLPSSYRWFALALREEPNNVWVSRNLQSVWNQMSDSEKRLAMRMTK